MNYNLSSLNEKVFIHPKNKDWYGTIRINENPKTEFRKFFTKYKSFALDDCGNIFYISNKGIVVFWDHETNVTIKLSKSFEDFLKNCIESDNLNIENTKAKVISKWSNPDFIPEFKENNKD